MTIYINHVGYLPEADKSVVMGGHLEIPFEVVSQADGKAAFRGELRRAPADFGQYTRGDFTLLTTPGTYFIRAGRETTPPFTIGSAVYDDAIAKVCAYFTLQRCGDTPLGWNSPCHLDDGQRGDNHLHQDVTGGWHDACDLRKWVSATIFGMLGLARIDRFSAAVEEELRWGNRYFLAMQEPAGYLMDFVGGDYFVHADNNRWTDNLIDGADDRLINVQPCDPVAQWVFVQAESILSMRLRASDPAYSLTCLDAALRCAAWTLNSQPNPSAAELGAGISACLALARASGDRTHHEHALAYARRLLALQVTRQVDSRSSVWGFFYERPQPGQSPFSYEPYRELWRGCWPLIGLVDLLTHLTDHAESDGWRNAIRLYVDSYLAVLAGRNAFGIVPYGLFRSDPGGGRALGRYWYRYFHPENPTWYVGINANLASTGVALVRAARILERPDWAALGQRQLDWILGANPYNASTVMAVGHNNPQHMFGEEYDPATPFLPGAVMNGISGTAEDAPQLRPGAWQECEYWTPMVAYTLRLLCELRRGPD